MYSFVAKNACDNVVMRTTESYDDSLENYEEVRTKKREAKNLDAGSVFALRPIGRGTSSARSLQDTVQLLIERFGEDNEEADRGFFFLGDALKESKKSRIPKEGFFATNSHPQERKKYICLLHMDCPYTEEK